MVRLFKPIFLSVLTTLVVVSVALTALPIIRGEDVILLNPKGPIARVQTKLLIETTILSILVMTPIYLATAIIARKYRAGNKKATYNPEDTNHPLLPILWWSIPTATILLLIFMVWQPIHDLDPFRPLEHEKSPLVIQVVALDWKWLFIYPEQHIATVNFVQFPENTPIQFKLTADGPMNSFWIPSLGGQMYAMSGMDNTLHLMADKKGDYVGKAAEINGHGFVDMQFTARASSVDEFATWIESVKKSGNNLDAPTYQILRQPSQKHPITWYTVTQQDLYDRIINSFMTSSSSHKTTTNSQH